MQECVASHLALPWLSHVEWALAVLLAHRVFGVMSITVMISWALSFSECVTLAGGYAMSGVATCSCGIWLVLWVFVLMKPSADFGPMLDFALHDITQEQHFVMGLLLAAAGGAEIYHALALATADLRLSAKKWPHSVWFCNMAMVGLIFIGHPQRSWGETQRHVALGLSMIGGDFSQAYINADLPPAEWYHMWPLLVHTTRTATASSGWSRSPSMAGRTQDAIGTCS